MKVFYAVSTHWDREWYKQFQGFRYDLVKVIDNVIENLENGNIDVFTLDGQTIVLEDYFEIKPNNRERIELLIKAGKLKVGPWYVMPDEFLVSGESIIKNFLMGNAVAKKYGGKPWKYGYMNDIFGHIAQMPQILRGFGIEAAYVGRGLGSDKGFTNFVWYAPDGSYCYAYKGRYADLKRQFSGSEDRNTEIDKFIESKTDETGAIILLYTDDHMNVDEDCIDFCRKRADAAQKCDMVEGLEKITSEVEKFKGILPCRTGELASTGHTIDDFRVVTNSISSYYPIKRENDICENILEKQTSPILVAAKIIGIELDKSFYDLAYKYLLKNQPHDSICGCSSYEVHEDMKYRYSQVHAISDALKDDFEQSLVAKRIIDGSFYISVLNYELRSYEGVFVTDILFDKVWQNKVFDNAKYQCYNDFSIIDEAGNEVQYQILGIEHDYIVSRKAYEPNKDRYTVAINGKLKAFGATKYTIIPQKSKKTVKKLSDGSLVAENRYLRLEISVDGSVNLLDKCSGVEHRGLNVFVDDGEIGNGWFSERPLSMNNIVSSKGSPCTVEILKNGDLITVFRVIKIMSVPNHVDYHTYERSQERAELKIITDITLKVESKTVEFETTVENNVNDHRLRVEFPTSIDRDYYYSSQAFTFVKRACGVTEEGANFAEPEVQEKHTAGIACVTDSEVSLAFVSKEGIHECGVSKNGVISATLLRGFGRQMWNAVKNNGAQIIGRHIFRYALTTEKSFSKLLRVKDEIHKVYPCITSDVSSQLPSLASLKGNVTVSIVKPSENGEGVVIRLFNPEENDEKCELTFNFDVKEIYKTDLLEEKREPLSLKENILLLEISPNKIENIYIEV